jgi:hypothetical protein
LKRAWAYLWALFFVLAPTLATACPACAGRDDGAGGKTIYLMGAMISVPFIIAAVVLRVFKKLLRDDPSLNRLESSK